MGLRLSVLLASSWRQHGALRGTREMWSGGGFDFCMTGSWPRLVVYKRGLTPFVSLTDAGEERPPLSPLTPALAREDTDGHGLLWECGLFLWRLGLLVLVENCPPGLGR